MSTQENSVFEARLDEALVQLQACQGEHHVTTCSGCEHFIGCEVRHGYVKTVYESMSKGDIGGFEF